MKVVKNTMVVFEDDIKYGRFCTDDILKWMRSVRSQLRNEIVKNYGIVYWECSSGILAWIETELDRTWTGSNIHYAMNGESVVMIKDENCDFEPEARIYGFIRLVYDNNMDVASLYPKTVLAPAPLEKLRNFCSDNNISVEGGYNNGHWVVTFSKFGVPYTVTFDSYTDYIGMGLDVANDIIDKLKARYTALKIWANSFYGMSTGRPTAFYRNPFENAVLKYCEEDVKATMEMSQFYADFTKSVKDNVDFNRIRNTKLGIEKVIFNKEATVVLWKDGTKTVVKCQDGDNFDKEKGLAMAICKKALGTNASHSNFNDIFKKWITED